VSVLEGGYSDKALLSGVMAHLTGLVDEGRVSGKDTDTNNSREQWWSLENVQMVRDLSFKEELGKTDLPVRLNSWKNWSRSVGEDHGLRSTRRTPNVHRGSIARRLY